MKAQPSGHQDKTLKQAKFTTSAVQWMSLNKKEKVIEGEQVIHL
jgi:hypothetical protein